ncbi:MAG TPA: hypothetical protein VHZ24_08740 [Pirellulales bacterium]|jgi:hypothetical protein|nr:hypothetical protein [Pirellulales bacterium]
MTKTDITQRTDVTTRKTVNDLAAGDRIEVVHNVKIGSSARWTTTTVGTVERVERRRHGLHFRRAVDDKVFSDLIVLRLDDGSLTTLTLDDFTTLRKV